MATQMKEAVQMIDELSKIDGLMSDLEGYLAKGNIIEAQKHLSYIATRFARLEKTETGPVAEFVSKALLAVAAPYQK